MQPEQRPCGSEARSKRFRRKPGGFRQNEIRPATLRPVQPESLRKHRMRQLKQALDFMLFSKTTNNPMRVTKSADRTYPVADTDTRAAQPRQQSRTGTRMRSYPQIVSISGQASTGSPESGKSGVPGLRTLVILMDGPDGGVSFEKRGKSLAYIKIKNGSGEKPRPKSGSEAASAPHPPERPCSRRLSSVS